jgi:urate oxidase
VAEHFAKTYSQAAHARVWLRERSWQRMRVEGEAHPHSFREAGAAVPVANVATARLSGRFWTFLRALTVHRSRPPSMKWPGPRSQLCRRSNKSR